MTDTQTFQNDSIFQYTSLVEMLGRQAQVRSDDLVFIYLKDGEREEVPITYRELDQRARVIAAQLQELHAEGERALLLYPPGLEYVAAFFGCLYAGMAAVPAYPPRLNRPAPRIMAILTDSGAAVALTNSDILANMERRFEHAPDLRAITWVNTDTLDPAIGNNWQEPAIDRDTLAFIQYTSGSTSTPKGVMLTHGNLLHNLEQVTLGFQISTSDVAVIWLPSYHDMGLIGGILTPVYVGMLTIIMAPLDFLQRPLRWLQAVSRYKASVSGGPNFAFDLCVDKIKPDQIDELDLSCWRVAFSGAEPVRLETINRFASTFAPCGFRREAFYPCYGLAEATLYMTGGDITAEPVTLTVSRPALENDQVVEVSPQDAGAQTLVGCGSTKLDQPIVIAHPEELTSCAPDQIGEIWTSGESIASGYWNREDETRHTFGAYLADSGAGPFMRTGDLGFVHNGELFITGRLKDLIIIRGTNHYPQDIELTVESCHEALQPAGGGAFSVDLDDEERLIVVQEVRREFRRSDLNLPINAIRQAISEHHDLQVYAIVLIKPFTVPKTSSGKIQRHACKAQYKEGSLKVLAEWHAGR